MQQQIMLQDKFSHSIDHAVLSVLYMGSATSLQDDHDSHFRAMLWFRARGFSVSRESDHL